MMTHQDVEEYQSYLLRVWRECRASDCRWRVSLESAQTGELRNFADLEKLFEFLRNETTGTKTFQS